MDVLDEPAPRIAADRVPEIVATHWGIEVDGVSPLSSERDLNVLHGRRHRHDPGRRRPARRSKVRSSPSR